MNESVQRLTPASLASRSAHRVDTILNAAFVLTGIVTTLLGPLIPLLATRWTISNLQTGYLFTAQFLSSLVGVSLSSLLTVRFGFRRLLAAGFGLMGAGVATLWFLPWPETLACVACYGVGLGIIIPTSNILIAEIHRPRPAPALNTLNFAWGLGAVASSLWVGALSAMHAVGAGLLGLGLVLAALPLLVAVGPYPLGSPTGDTPRLPREPSEGKRTKLSVSVAIGLLFCLYVGTETSVGGWVAAYAKRVAQESHGAWVFAPGFFWAALLGGRALAPKVLEKISDQTLMLAELSVATLGIAFLIAARSIGAIFAATAVAGIGLAPIFPGAVALLSEHFGAAAKRSGGWMFGLAAVGGASLPWLVGYVTTRSGEFRAGLSVPLAGALAMLIVFALVGSKPKPFR